MSVAGRRPRLENDCYYSPFWTVRVLARMLPHYFESRSILDPCAGEGAILRACASFGVDKSRLLAWEITENDELEKHAQSVRFGDCLEMKIGGDERVFVLTNPPFLGADQVIERFINDDRVGIAAFLLRLNYLAPKKRNKIATKNPPSDLIVLPRRPVFAHFCKGLAPTKNRLRVPSCGATYSTRYKGPCPRCAGHVGAQSDATDYAWHVWAWPPGVKKKPHTKTQFAPAEFCK